MKCPECQQPRSSVVRTATLDTVVWRTRRCDQCGFEWRTSEQQDEPLVPIQEFECEKKHA